MHIIERASLGLMSLRKRTFLDAVKIVLIFFFIDFFGSILMHFSGRSISAILSYALGAEEIRQIPISNRLVLQSGPLGAAVRMLIWAPLLEETVFRLWLRYSRERVIISLCGLIVFISLQFLRSNTNEIARIGIISIALILIFGISFKVISFFKQYFPLSFRFNVRISIWISGVVFGLVHVTNYSLEINPWYLCLPMVLPQIFSGTLIGAVRCNYGFVYGVAIHFLLNALSLFIALN